MLTRCEENIWINDTMSLGKPGVVAAYLIQGKENALIDMGYASSAETVLKDLTGNGFTAEDIDYLLPTHVHLDHSGACGALASVLTSADIRVHPKGQRHLIDPAKFCEGATELFGEELMKQYGRPMPIHRNRVKVMGDGEKISLGNGVTLRAVWTPGHASHHLSYLIEESGMVLTGDAVGISSSAFPVLIPTTPPTSFNLEAAVESLRRLKQLSPKQLLTPHYGILRDAPHSIDMNVETLERWTTRISEMLKNGISIDSMVNRLTDETARRTQNPVELVPGHLRVSMRLSVLGAVRYLNSFEHSTAE